MHLIKRSLALPTVFGVLILALAPVMAEAKQTQPRPRYSLTVLGTLGGSFSQAAALNDRGEVAGFSTLAGDQTVHASIWTHGVATDLGTLGGPLSYVSEGYPINDRGVVVGYSQTSTPDPNGEDFCGFFAGGNLGPLTCLPFVWQNGTMNALPTLGGNNGFATAINNAGQIVGIAETSTPETACAPALNFRFEGVLWQGGAARELAPLPGDTDSGTSAINNSGEVVGVSAPDCTSPSHAVLWRDGNPTNLGTLGGATGNIAFAINDRGQVVGQSDLPGDLTHQAFLWQNGRMTGLGTILGLPVSLANAINDSGQVVGFSQDETGNNTTAWIWQNGTMTDLNTLIPSGTPMYLLEALGVNRRGQITGYGLLPDGEIRGYVLTPCASAPAAQVCDVNSPNAPATGTSPRASKATMLRPTTWRPNGRLGIITGSLGSRFSSNWRGDR